MAIIDEIKKYDTGLTKEQIAEAFLRALNDYSDDDIDLMLRRFEKVIFEHGERIETGTDLNELTETGAYFAPYADVITYANCPTTSAFRLDMIQTGQSTFLQKIIEADHPIFYARSYISGTFTAWKKFEGTEV